MAGQAQHGIPRLSEAVISISRAPTSESVQVLRCMLQGQLGEALASTGQYAEARTACEAALAVAEGLDDLRAQGLGEGQLGAVALAEGKTEEALTRFRAASALFQRMGELIWRRYHGISSAKFATSSANRTRLTAITARRRASGNRLAIQPAQLSFGANWLCYASKPGAQSKPELPTARPSVATRSSIIWRTMTLRDRI